MTSLINTTHPSVILILTGVSLLNIYAKTITRQLVSNGSIRLLLLCSNISPCKEDPGNDTFVHSQSSYFVSV